MRLFCLRLTGGPAIFVILGSRAVTAGSLLISGLLCFSLFSLPLQSSQYLIGMHVASCLLLSALLATCLPLLNASISSSSTAKAQGRAFGGMALLGGAGNQIGGVVGSHLFDSDGSRFGLSTYGLPFFFAGCLLVLSSSLILCSRCGSKRRPAQLVAVECETSSGNDDDPCDVEAQGNEEHASTGLLRNRPIISK